jgi:hypothetical protein
MEEKMKSKNQARIFLCLLALLSLGIFQLIGNSIDIVSANNTPQTLPFAQNWSNTNLITTNDDWSNVPGIVGYLGDIAATSTTNVDPRTLLADYSTVSAVDVIANQTNPDTATAGGVAEFEITNPTIALQGSGTADAPHIVIHLNTTGQTNIRFAANIRDIDGSADDAVQQIDVQYRVGGAGDYVSIPGGYIADATTGGSATQITPLNLALPANANNQALVQIRVITTNAGGSDEWVGIDDISVTADGGGTPTPTMTPTPTPTATPTPTVTPTPARDANVDFNGDGRSDWVVTRAADTSNPNSQKMWIINTNGTNNVSFVPFGLNSDIAVPEDYDGDGRDDIAVWRPGAPFVAAFYILESRTSTLRVEVFGQTGDDPRVVTDYDGDNRADVAVYRKFTSGNNFFYFRGSANNPNRITSFVPWGSGVSVVPNVGDYDGDGKGDFCVYDTSGFFYLLRSTDSGHEFIKWGAGGGERFVVPGDFDGDGRSDFSVVRNQNNQLVWYILERDGGGTGANGIAWGILGDTPAPGDYDGDGRQDIAVWRPNADPTMNFFFVRRSSDGSLLTHEWGSQGDAAEASWYIHQPTP